ncbi:MAG: hypothetical protein AAF236_07325 [Verrucomicrobiota bacterium]
MKHALSVLLILGIAVSSAFSQSSAPVGPFSLSFVPSESLESQDVAASSNLESDPSLALGGFNLGIRSPGESEKLSWHSHLNVTEFQTLLSAGVSSVLFETDSYLIACQALGGYAFGHKHFADSWHGSFDIYGARALGSEEKHFLKLGVFVDVEEDFGKWGPEAALLLGADKQHPVTLDFAYGHGLGGEFEFNNYVWSVAEHDLQLRAGVFLSENLQVGLSGQYQKWDDLSGTEEDWKTGGFVNWYSDKGLVFSIGAAAGEQGTNGFASLSFQPATYSVNPLDATASGKGGFAARPRFAPRTWMLSPVRRLQTVGIRQVQSHDFAQTQTQTQNMIGGSAVATFFLFGDPLTVIGTPSDRLRVTYTNTTNFPQNVTIVSMELFGGGTFNPGVSGVVNSNGTITAETPPGSNSAAASHVQTVVISVNGQTFSLDFTFPGTVTNGFTTAPITIP